MKKAVDTSIIVREPAPILREKAAEVPVQDMTGHTIRSLIRAMKAALAATPDGVGLAAPQIGVSRAVFIVSEEAEEIDRAQKAGWKRGDKRHPDGDIADRPYEKRPWKYYVFINPAAANTSRKSADGPEGCLSVPERYGTVARREKITVRAYNERGEKFTRHCSRFFARVVQHELDHLIGALFVDKAKDLMEIPGKEYTKETQ